MFIVARTDINTWQPVIDQSNAACIVSDTKLRFEEIWAEDLATRSFATLTPHVIPWRMFLPPLPSNDVSCIGYALTYPGHAKEMKQSHSFFFAKGGSVLQMNNSIQHRPNLDYEAEVGLLLHRKLPNRFGFLMFNDLTDRGIQVCEFSRNPSTLAQVFSKAKSFPGSMLVGPLLAIGDEHDWEQLTITLKVNSAIRQSLHARNCSLRPSAIHKTLFAASPDCTWLLAATGTPEGVILTNPTLRRKVTLLLSTGLSVQRARRKHLSTHVFLRPGDNIEMYSPELGYGRTVIGENREEDQYAHVEL